MYMYKHMGKEEIDRMDSAIALHDGGWRAEDRDQLLDEYDMTPEEADQIAALLDEIATTFIKNR